MSEKPNALPVNSVHQEMTFSSHSASDHHKTTQGGAPESIDAENQHKEDAISSEQHLEDLSLEQLMEQALRAQKQKITVENRGDKSEMEVRLSHGGLKQYEIGACNS